MTKRGEGEGRDLVVTENITVDGVIDATEGWFAPAGDDAVDQSDVEAAIPGHNLRADPRVLVKARPARVRDGLRMRWRTGTAHPMSEDDARARHRRLGRGRPGYRLDGILLRALATDIRMLTIRIELDPPV